jgi:beta-glucanase (GH16 family)
MINKFILNILILTGIAGCATQDQFRKSFSEDFDRTRSKFFLFNNHGKDIELTKISGTSNNGETTREVLVLRIDPQVLPGAGKGPEIISKRFTHFGTYAVRLKVPDVREIQPNVGAVVGYFTYHVDQVEGLSEIDYEWLIADPTVLYIGTWTGPRGSLKRIGRTLNLAEGKIYSTTHRVGHHGVRMPLTGQQNEPETIPAIKGYDASKHFYTYGFDWYPDRIRWWMIHPQTADTVVLWNYHGSQLGIPRNETRYRLNFWYTRDWPVETNPLSIERPLHPYEVEVDWMSYEPWEVNDGG